MFVERFVERVRQRFVHPVRPNEGAFYDALERRALEPEKAFFSDRFLR